MKKNYLLLGIITIFNLFISCSNNNAAEKIIHLDFQREIVSLNGTWKYLENQRDESIWEMSKFNSEKWNEVEQPGPVLKGSEGEKIKNTDCIWLKRSFEISAQQAQKDVVLKWGAVRFGAKVWINGKEINNKITNGPNTVLIPSDLVNEGSNTILIRANGWKSLFNSESEKVSDARNKNFPLTPVGGSSQGWGAKDPRILDDIWLEFYDQAYMKYILAIPDVNNNTVTFRIWLDANNDLPKDLQVQIECKFQNDSEVISTQLYNLDNTKNYQEVTYKINDPHLWWPDNPVLYNARLELKAGETVCDKTDFNFGMRQIEVVNGDYMLNNKRIKLHGSNMVHEWNWGPKFTDNAKQYIVDEARNMNLNSFRTHTIPPITSWLNIADENGMMFLAEMPLLFNYQDPKFTDKEWEIYRANALEDEKGWITKIWNHPSIVVWVISNESPFDSIWEQTVLRDMVLSNDPTRPILRTGERTVETNDWHPCSNFNSMMEGTFSFMLDRHIRKGNANQTHTNSEYMNIFSSWKDLAQRYLGDTENSNINLAFAEIGMEHTELMRQREYDMILPYMYAGWTGIRLSTYWHPEYPTPMAAALHSCMSPVIASMDLWNRNFTCGQEIEIPLHMINDLYDDVDAEIEIIITTADPVFVPHKDSLKTSVWTHKFDYKYKPLSYEIKEVTVQLPEKAGKYYLSVIMNRDGDRPVTSQRIVRTFSPHKPENNNKILLLGATQISKKWLSDNDYKFDENFSSLPDADVILIWDAAQIDNSLKIKSDDILNRINTGAKLVILNQDSLNWDELIDIKYGDKNEKTRGFINKGEESNILFSGIDNEYFQRWNGLPLSIANRELKGEFVDKSTKLLWADNPDHSYLISQKYGKGNIIISQLLVRNHINKNSENYDPVAEQLLLNLLN